LTKTEALVAKTLERALTELAALPEAAQEQIGQELLAQVAKLRALRTDLEQGVASLASGRSRSLDVEEVLDRAHQRHGKR
jgi:hypothetical protein